MIITLSGEPGVGKSYQSMLFEEPVLILDIENRDEKKRARFFKDKLIRVIEIKQYDENFKSDYNYSCQKLYEEIKNIIANHDEISTIVIDGITDVRNKLSRARWLKNHPKRKNPMSTDYREINDTVRKLIEPLINLARETDTNLILTAQMVGKYGKVKQNLEGQMIPVSANIGRKPASMDSIDFDVDIIINLNHPADRKGRLDLNTYIATCTKSDIGTWEYDITNTNLYDLLLELNL